LFAMSSSPFTMRTAIASLARSTSTAARWLRVERSSWHDSAAWRVAGGGSWRVHDRRLDLGQPVA
jgi:hypothetical protein